jgi:N-acyl-D-amino-acid deacylase
VVTGQCGFSPGPLSEESKKEFVASLGSLAEGLPLEKISSFGSVLEFIQNQGISINMSPLVGHGTIRAAVMGYSSARPDEDQIEAMKHYAEQAMDEGAIGISTGLIYPPGYYSTTEELIEVTRPVADKGGMYFSHVRNEGANLLDSIEEERRIAQATGVALQHSHYKAAGESNWHLAEKGLETIEKVRSEGIDMTVDMYPYVASSNGLIDALPDWSREGGLEKTMKRLKDPTDRKRIRGTMSTQNWDKNLIAGSPNPDYVGRYVAELAAEAGRDPYEWVFEALIETRGDIDRIVFGMSEDNVKMQLQYDFMMIGTDGYGIPPTGPLAEGAPHPRSFGTFPRVLGKYVREEKVLSLEKAIWKMTGFPKQKLGWKDRGLIKPGYQADVVIFDPSTVMDQATFIKPQQYPLGIEQVIVNGKFIIRDGKHTHALPGKIISLP